MRGTALIAKYPLAIALADNAREVFAARLPHLLLFFGLPTLTLVLAELLRAQSGVRGPAIDQQTLQSLCRMFGCIPGQFWEQAQIWMALTVVLLVLSVVIVIYVAYSVANFFYVRPSDGNSSDYRLGTAYYWFIGGGGIFAGAISFALAGRPPDYLHLFPNGVVEHLQFVRALRETQFLSMLDWSFSAVNTGVAFTATFIVLSVVLTVTNVNPSLDERLIARQRARFNTLLYLASTVLVVGVVQMSTWARLPLSIFDSFIKQAPVALEATAAAPLVAKVSVINAQYQAVATGYVTFAGITFVAILVAIFLPASKMLDRTARDKAVAAVTSDEKEPPAASVDKWLAERGLTDRTWDRVTTVLALLAPFIAAPIAQFLQSLLKEPPPATQKVALSLLTLIA